MSQDLNEVRERIRKIDEQMARLFAQRMNEVKNVALCKKECGLPVDDDEQKQVASEQDIFIMHNAELSSYYDSYFEHITSLSKKYQHRLLEGTKIAYTGAEGAFAHIAAMRIFPDAKLMAFASFEEAYNAVEKGECSSAVIPIENSYAGEVGSVMDIMFDGKLFLTGVYSLPITQNLLGVSGAEINKIKKVISHPQALSQCDTYIRSRGWEIVSATNTAVAARKVANDNDPTVAAIASAETAGLYGLDILDHDINESVVNTTKFAVFSNSENDAETDSENIFILMFTVNNVAGSLAKAINVISDYGFNMKALRSRPVKEKAWQYYFYVEAEGNEKSQQGIKMLEQLSKQCEKLKIVGHYSREVSLKRGIRI